MTDHWNTDKIISYSEKGLKHNYVIIQRLILFKMHLKKLIYTSF